MMKTESTLHKFLSLTNRRDEQILKLRGNFIDTKKSNEKSVSRTNINSNSHLNFTTNRKNFLWSQEDIKIKTLTNKFNKLCTNLRKYTKRDEKNNRMATDESLEKKTTVTISLNQRRKLLSFDDCESDRAFNIHKKSETQIPNKLATDKLYTMLSIKSQLPGIKNSKSHRNASENDHKRQFRITNRAQKSDKDSESTTSENYALLQLSENKIKRIHGEISSYRAYCSSLDVQSKAKIEKLKALKYDFGMISKEISVLEDDSLFTTLKKEENELNEYFEMFQMENSQLKFMHKSRKGDIIKLRKVTREKFEEIHKKASKFEDYHEKFGLSIKSLENIEIHFKRLEKDSESSKKHIQFAKELSLQFLFNENEKEAIANEILQNKRNEAQKKDFERSVKSLLRSEKIKEMIKSNKREMLKLEGEREKLKEILERFGSEIKNNSDAQYLLGEMKLLKFHKVYKGNPIASCAR